MRDKVLLLFLLCVCLVVRFLRTRRSLSDCQVEEPVLDKIENRGNTSECNVQNIIA